MTASDNAHLAVTLPDGQTAVVDLGPAPAPAVQDISTVAEPGTELRARTFRIDAMPLGAIVAATVTVAGETYRLRSDDLRPT